MQTKAKLRKANSGAAGYSAAIHHFDQLTLFHRRRRLEGLAAVKGGGIHLGQLLVLPIEDEHLEEDAVLDDGSFLLGLDDPRAFDDLVLLGLVGDLGYAAAGALLHLAEQVVHLEMLQGRAGEPRPLPSGKPSRTESLKGRVPFKFACIAFAAPPLADTARQACQATSPRGPSAAVSKLSEGREGSG